MPNNLTIEQCNNFAIEIYIVKLLTSSCFLNYLILALT